MFTQQRLIPTHAAYLNISTGTYLGGKLRELAALVIDMMQHASNHSVSSACYPAQVLSYSKAAWHERKAGRDPAGPTRRFGPGRKPQQVVVKPRLDDKRKDAGPWW